MGRHYTDNCASYRRSKVAGGKMEAVHLDETNCGAAG